jgi:SAM-dependent methyltransferase
MRYFGTDSGVGNELAWDYSNLSFKSDLTALPVREGEIDAVVSVSVLEHVAGPAPMLAECYRVLRPGGSLYMVVPQSWPRHQDPNDYYRFTRHAVDHLFGKIGFTPKCLEAIGGVFWNFGLRSIYLLTHLRGRAFPVALVLAPLLGFLIPLFCFYLDRLDRYREDTLGYTVIAYKQESTRGEKE